MGIWQIVQSQNEHGHFESTRWSVILRAKDSGPAADEALEVICASYWTPLYAFARRWGNARQDAEDAVQSFFLTALKRRLFLTANPEKGRLRNLLLTAFKHHLQDLAGGASATRRSPGAPGNLVGLEDVEERLLQVSTAAEDAELVFDREWARAVLNEAFKRLENRYFEEGKAAVFHALRPLILEHGETRERPIDALGLSQTAAGVALHRLRKRFRESLRDVISETVEKPEEIESEFRALAKSLAQAGL